MLKIEHLTKTYGEKKAVDDLSLEIRAGEICAFLGHNGAGKTTTLKTCCGILRPDGGTVQVDGISVADDPLEAKRRLAYLPDNPDLYEYMTGIQYLNFIADVFGVDAQTRAERIAAYSEKFALTADLAQPISAYSHGMKQKLAIISALLHDPKLILMDEPFVGLDPIAAHRLKTVMRAFCDKGGSHLLLDPCAGSGRKALRPGGHHPAGQAGPCRIDGRSQGGPLAGKRLSGVGGGRLCLRHCCKSNSAR